MSRSWVDSRSPACGGCGTRCRVRDCSWVADGSLVHHARGDGATATRSSTRNAKDERHSGGRLRDNVRHACATDSVRFGTNGTRPGFMGLESRISGTVCSGLSFLSLGVWFVSLGEGSADVSWAAPVAYSGPAARRCRTDNGAMSLASSPSRETVWTRRIYNEERASSGCPISSDAP